MTIDLRAATLRIVAALALCAALTACAPADDAARKWQVINYWATWCAPCIEEIPELNRLAAGHGERVVVYGVNFDGLQGEELAAAVSELGIAFEVLAEDPAARLGFQRPQVLPSTFLVDPDGRLHTTLVGPQTAATVLAAMETPAP